MAGVPMRLVQRFELRHEATKPSSDGGEDRASARRRAACTRKMKISAPAIEVFAPGMRTGKRPTIAATVAPIITWIRNFPSMDATFAIEYASTANPRIARVHQ